MSASRKPSKRKKLDFEISYQKWIQKFSTWLPWSLALFGSVTLLEGQFGFLSEIAGSTWVTQIGRTSSAVGGQGNLSARAILGMAKTKMQTDRTHYLFVGDSVFTGAIGGNTWNDLPPSTLVSAKLPHSLNLGQEGSDWALNSMLIRKLSNQELVKEQLPLLITDINLKFLLWDYDFTPPFPAEMELCAESPENVICQHLEEAWPKGLTLIYHWSPLVLNGLLGQFDFFLTYGLKAPIYTAKGRGFGILPFRSFLPGIVDANYVMEREKTNPTPIYTMTYGNIQHLMNMNANIFWMNFHSPDFRKKLWLNSLIQSIGSWPGPKLVLWVGNSPNSHSVLTPENQTKTLQLGEEITQQVKNSGISNLKVISVSSVLTEPDDYIDTDHWTPKGHQKFAEYLQANYNPETRTWK